MIIVIINKGNVDFVESIMRCANGLSDATNPVSVYKCTALEPTVHHYHNRQACRLYA